MSAKHSNIPIFIPHSACPNDCVFCNQKRIAGVNRPPTPKEVDKILSEAVKNINPDVKAQAAFFGGSFTGLDEKLMKAYLECAYKYIQNGAIDGIRLSTRPDYIDEDILSLLKQYGVTTIELGAQSMADCVLSASKRGHTAQQTEKASRLIKQNGFELVLQMMTGLPQDTDAGVFDTAEKIAKLEPDAVRIYPVIVIKDTELETLYYEGFYKPQTLEEAVNICSELILFFEDKGIKVIRVGLYADIPLENSVVAGPFHPAFGELCEARNFLKNIKSNMPNSAEGKSIVIYTPKNCTAKTVGHKRENIKIIMDMYKLKDIRVKEDETLKDREIRIAVI